jgi:RES domain-containing protein
MTPLPPPLGGADLVAPQWGANLVAWRLDMTKHASTWDSGEGAYLAGGRWNSRGVRAVYCAVDPSTAILEVAVHKGFRALDIVPHTLTLLRITDPARVHVLDPAAVPNPNWLRPGLPSAGQQAFGDALLAAHSFVVLPSVVSTHSWNLVFVASVASGGYTVLAQEDFALDPRLHPPPS